MTERKGDWLQTYSGRAFWPLDPWPEEVTIRDIAHALSNICRFNGHSQVHCSVAQHSVLVSRLVTPVAAMAGLLHDAAEAYVCDMPVPLKRCAGLGVLHEEIEARVQAAIAAKFDLCPEEFSCGEVRGADAVALATECRDFMGGQRGGQWGLMSPIDQKLEPMTAIEAKVAFLERFLELKRY